MIWNNVFSNDCVFLTKEYKEDHSYIDDDFKAVSSQIAVEKQLIKLLDLVSFNKLLKNDGFFAGRNGKTQQYAYLITLGLADSTLLKLGSPLLKNQAKSRLRNQLNLE